MGQLSLNAERVPLAKLAQTPSGNGRGNGPGPGPGLGLVWSVWPSGQVGVLGPTPKTLSVLACLMCT